MIFTLEEEEGENANEPASPVTPTDWEQEAREAYLRGYGQGMYDRMISVASSSAGPAPSTNLSSSSTGPTVSASPLSARPSTGPGSGVKNKLIPTTEAECKLRALRDKKNAKEKKRQDKKRRERGGH